MDFKRHFLGLRSEYSKILDEFPLASYEDAWSTLEPPLCKLWLATYKSICDRETYVELLQYRGANSVHDSICTLGYEESCRVIGVITVSQEILSLEVLLDRLADQQNKGVSSTAALDLINNTLISLQEGVRAQVEDLRQAAGCAAQMDLWEVTSIVRPFTQSLAYWSRRRAMYAVRGVQRTLNEGLAAIGVRYPDIKIKKGQVIDAAHLSDLCKMSEEIDARLPPERRIEVARGLLRYAGNSTKVLMGQLRNGYSDELMERALHFLAPLTRDRPPRPRYQVGARHHHLGDGQDVGHFVAHSTGGPPDINLFYQDRRLNRGWSAEGKVYRSMEQYAADHPGTFYFSRPVYEGESTVPRFLELGILLKADDVDAVMSRVESRESTCICGPASSQRLAVAWWIGVFDNQPALGAASPRR